VGIKGSGKDERTKYEHGFTPRKWPRILLEQAENQLERIALADQRFPMQPIRTVEATPFW
jgi:hypothetical protein